MLRLLCIVGFAAALGTAGVASATGPSPSGGLSGIVTGWTDGLGMPSVSVTLRSLPTSPARPHEDAVWVEVRNTDTEGVFRFDDVPAGLYSIEARLDGRAWSVEPVLVVRGQRLLEHIVLGDAPEPHPVPQT
jgi:hypothetical protein